MKKNLTYQILEAHLKSGNMIAGEEISIAIDYTLTQDSTGTMAYLQFEAMDVPRVKTKKSLAYIDHNTLQSGPEMPTTTRISAVSQKNTAYIFRAPATAFVTRSTSNGSVSLAVHSWVLTATHPPAAG